MNDNLPAVRDESGELSITDLVGQVTKIQQAMKAVMHDGEHYGTIPGTPKPTLLKPGAEKLCLLFRLNPEYEILAQTEEPDFIAFTIRCVLLHIPTGNRVASGLGSCSSREEKYGWRKEPRRCPKCGQPAIIKGNAEYGGGWVCWKKKNDGCGAKFQEGDRSVEDQTVGRVPTENIWDQHNTLLKMASKRALVAAVLNGTAASDLFTQDLEDMAGRGEERERPPAQDSPPKREAKSEKKNGDRAPDNKAKLIGQIEALALEHVGAKGLADALYAWSRFDKTDGSGESSVDSVEAMEKVGEAWLRKIKMTADKWVATGLCPHCGKKEEPGDDLP